MQEGLTFLRTLTVEQFKTKMLVKSIKVKKNPKTGSLFFTYGGEVGAVSLKGIPSNPMISEVIGSDGAEFWLLHEESAGAETLAEF